MARCRAYYNSEDSEFELTCDLDEHEGILTFHYDKLRELEWRHPLVPVGVTSTRTTPPKKTSAKATARKPMDIILGRIT